MAGQLKESCVKKILNDKKTKESFLINQIMTFRLRYNSQNTKAVVQRHSTEQLFRKSTKNLRYTPVVDIILVKLQVFIPKRN